MAMTNNTKKTLLDILTKNNVNENPRTELPAPIKVYDYRIIQVSYGGTSKKILKLFFYKDLVIEYAETYKNHPKIEYEFSIFLQPIVGRYDTHLQWTVGKYETLAGDKGIPEFKELKLTDDGVFYGLAKIGDKIHFMKFHNFLEDDNYQDYKTYQYQTPKTIYPDAIFDIETEITTDEFDEREFLEVKLGNAVFGDGRYDKIAFNRDAYDKNKFAFVMWEETTQQITMVQFLILENNINSIRKTEFIINKNISLSEGNNLPGSNFENISTLGVLTGDTQTTGNKVNKGSIIFSTEQGAGEDKEIAFNNIYQHKNVVYPFNVLSHTFTLMPIRNFNWVEYNDQITAIRDHEMQKIFEDLKTHIAASPKELNYHLIIELPCINGEVYKIRIEKNDIKKFYYGNFIQFRVFFKTSIRNNRSGVGTSNSSYDLKHEVRGEIVYQTAATYPNYRTSNGISFYERTGRIFRGQPQKKNLQDFFSARGKIFKYNPAIKKGFWTINVSPLNYVKFLTTVGTNTFSAFLYVNGKLVQKSVKENNTSQIMIIENKTESNNKEINYYIYVSENNVYEGKSPVFINPRRALIPLKSKATNEYNVFDFNDDKSSEEVSVDRFYNEVASTRILVLNLLNPTSIISVNVNNQNYEQYVFNRQKRTITFNNLSANDQVSVHYRTNVKKPVKIENSFNTLTSNFQIAAVANKDELPTSFPSIVGAFNTNDNKNEVFNLYDSYSKIIKNDLSENTGVKNFVYGYRQKNILWIATAILDEYNQFLEVAVWQQIYGETDDPYFKLPYSANAKNLNMVRLNIQNDRFKKGLFDNRFLDITTHNNITVASTTIGIRDLTGDGGNQTVIFGNTNMPLFKIPRKISKQFNEVKDVNMNVEVVWVDEKNNTNQTLSNKFANLFNGAKTVNLDDLGLDKYEVWTDKNKIWKQGPMEPENITTSVEDGTINIEFEIPNIPKEEVALRGKINRVKLISTNNTDISEDFITPCDEPMIFNKTIKIESE